MNTKKKVSSKTYDKIEKVIGYSFKRKQTLTNALTHRSYSNELRKQGKVQYNNERIEFLGDAVLELVVSDYLYRTYPDLQEGIMTLARAAVVKTTSLAEEVVRLGLGEFLIMGHGEEKTGGRNKEYLLANLYESLVGAVYFDGGMKKASAFIEMTLFEKIQKAVEQKDYTDSKTRLQEITQQDYKITPTYTIIQESGPAHERIYVAAVHVGDKKLSEGSGTSKQKAEENAAEKALGLLDNLKRESHAQN